MVNTNSENKAQLQEALRDGTVLVTFTKVDGTDRTLRCTTSASLVPAVTLEKTSAVERKVNENICPVYDLDAGHWKSFRWDSLKNFEKLN